MLAVNGLSTSTARVAVAFLLASTTACYTYAHLATGTTPAVGERYALHISDPGRANLADRFGPGLSIVEGRLAELSPAAFGLHVFKVEYFGNQVNTWAGESV